MNRSLLVVPIALLAAACARPRPAVVETENHTALPFPWWPGTIQPIRVTPLDYAGNPINCVADQDERPCDIEVTDAGEVFYRSRTPAPAGVIGPGLELRREGEAAAFALEANGALVGHGLFHAADSAQVMFCRMTAAPALECHHDFEAAAGTRIWNETNCLGSLIARIDGGAIVFESVEYPGPATIAARVEPAPDDDAAEALALFVYAMHLVEYDTVRHTPYVSDMQRPR